MEHTMAGSDHEVYENPTVKQVIFAVHFPNLFYMDKKIGDFQMKVMERFPESQLLHRRSIVIADLPPEGSPQDIPAELEPPGLKAIWQFKSKTGVSLNVTTSSLDLSSEEHKTYDAEGKGPRFRDTIAYAVQAFLDVMGMPILTRIGLRYIDDCPLPSRPDNEAFSEYYGSSFPLKRFPIRDAVDMAFSARLRREDKYMFRFSEHYRVNEGQRKLVLDIDASAENIHSGDFLEVTDRLHSIIHAEYEGYIREPVREIMRRKENSEHAEAK